MVTLNILLLLKHEYIKEEGLKEDLEIMLKLLMYLMMMFLSMRFLLEVKNAFDCQCRRMSASTVVPDNGNLDKNSSNLNVQKKNLEEGENGIKYFEENGKKFANFEFGEGVVEVPVNTRDEYHNKVLKFYTKRYESYQKEQERKKAEELEEIERNKEKEKKKKKDKTEKESKKEQKKEENNGWRWRFRIGNSRKKDVIKEKEEEMK